MKRKKNLLLPVVLALLMVSAHGQNIGNWGKAYSPSPDKSDSYYNRQANRLEKDGDLLRAVSNAVLALKLADKKRQVRRAQETLHNVYAKALEEGVGIVQSLKETIDSSEGDQRVLAASRIASTYKTLSGTMEVLREIPKDKLKMKKVGTLSFEILDFSEEIAEADRDLSKALDHAAAYYYRLGSELLTQADSSFAADSTGAVREDEPDLSHQERMSKIEKNKAAAKQFLKSMEFRRAYKDAPEKYATAKDLGTTRIVAMAFEDHYNKSAYEGDLGASVANRVAVALREKDYEFLEVKSKAIQGIRFVEASGPDENTLEYLMANHEGAHVALIGVLTGIQVKRSRAEPVVAKVEREVVVKKETYTDSDGNEKVREVRNTVRATFTAYSKNMDVVVGGTYQIVSLINGEVLKSGEITGTDTFLYTWGTFSGDKRALSGYQQSLADRGEIDYPKTAPMVREASIRLSSNIADDVEAQYVAFVGR